MAVAPAIRRLLRVLEIEEEQARTALASAQGDLRLLEHRLNACAERNRRGRQLVVASATSGNLIDRWAGLEEARLSTSRVAFLKPRIPEAQMIVAARRQEYLAKRVERRQAETLIEEAEARAAVEEGRRSQQALDDWYLNRLHRSRLQAQSKARPSSAAQGQLEESAADQT